MTTIRASQLVKLDEWPNWDVVNVSVGPRADPLVLLWERPETLPLDPDEAKHPGITILRRRRDGPNRFRVIHLCEGTRYVLDLTETTRNYLYAQPLPGGDYLLVGAWPRNGAPNADVYATDGLLLRSWQAGGCVMHVQATTDGQIWTGYGDEGVLETRLGSHGAICFDAEGRVLIGYNSLAKTQGVEGIFDCYAMNVASDTETWLWYYIGFPLVRMTGGQITGFWPHLKDKAPIAGSHAFAIAGERLLFQGGYHDHDRYYLMSLHGQRSQELTPVDENGAPIHVHAFRPFGRGSHLYLRTDHALFAVDISTIEAP